MCGSRGKLEFDSGAKIAKNPADQNYALGMGICEQARAACSSLGLPAAERGPESHRIRTRRNGEVGSTLGLGCRRSKRGSGEKVHVRDLRKAGI